MRKSLSIILIVAMLLSLSLACIPASAAEENNITLMVETWEKPWEDPLYASDWIAIGSTAEWVAAFNASSVENHKFYLTADLDFEGVTDGGGNPANFLIDGNGHTITLAKTGNNRALFSNPGNFTVQNLIIKGDILSDGDVYGENSGAWNGPFSFWDQKGWVKLYNVTSAVNVTYTRNVNGSQYPSGLIANCHGGEFENVKYVGTVTVGNKAMVGAIGGLVSFCSGSVTFKNCVNDGIIQFLGKSAYYTASPTGAPGSQIFGAGGFVGNCSGTATFENCENNADIIYSGFDVYSLEVVDQETGKKMQTEVPAVQSNGSATSCVSYVGGFAGYSAAATFDNCVNNGTIYLGDASTSNHLSYVGGFYGGVNGSSTNPFVIRNSTNNGDITAIYNNPADIGGFVGFVCNNAANVIEGSVNNGAITSCKNNSLNTSYTSIGGFIGYVSLGSKYNFSLSIKDSVNNGDLKSNPKGNAYKEMWGGLIGHTVGVPLMVIENAINNGDVLMPMNRTVDNFSQGAAGFIGCCRTVGKNWSNIASASYTFTNCLNTGTVTGIRAAGFYGDNAEMNLSDDDSVTVDDLVFNFENCVNAGNIYGKDLAGGFAGYVGKDGGVTVNVKNSSNGGIICGANNAGGLLALMTGASVANVENFVNYGPVGAELVDENNTVTIATAAKGAGLVAGNEGMVSAYGAVNLGTIKGTVFVPFVVAGLANAENNVYFLSATIDDGFVGGDAVEDPEALIEIANGYEIPYAANYATIAGLIAESKNMNAGDYLPEADWDGLKAACAAAEAVITAEDFDPSSYSQVEANALYLSILKPYSTFVLKTDVSALGVAINNAKGKLLDGVEYTNASIKTLNKAIEAAEAIFALGERARSTDVTEAIADLEKAISKLREMPAPVDYSALEELIEEIGELNEDDYTAKTWKALKEALTSAKTSLSASKQNQVDAAVTALSDAVAALELKNPETEAPETAAPEGETSDETDSEIDPSEKNGCGSVIGGVAVALTAVIALAGVSLKKKED